MFSQVIFLPGLAHGLLRLIAIKLPDFSFSIREKTTQLGQCLREQGANLHEKAEEPPSATAQASQGATPAFPLPSERWWLELEADRRYRPSATCLGDRPGSVSEGPRAAPRPAQLWKTGGRRLGCVQARPPLAM